MSSSNLTPQERAIGLGLAALFALRMLGLFLILPVFAVFARDFPGGDNLTLVGVALGAYGITQACLQIAYGSASDRWGRKPVIIFGLLLFIAGSVVAALAEHLNAIIAGRVLQGAGAISAAVTALAADLVPAEKRTRVMAMIGSSIGLTFALSLVLAPLLLTAIGMAGIFWLTGLLGVAAIFLVLNVVPDAVPVQDTSPVSLLDVWRNPQLARLNFGVFTLHLIQTALWVLVPPTLVDGGLPAGSHWQVYLPAVLLSFAVMVPAIILAEKRGLMQPVFTAAVALLLVVIPGFYFAPAQPVLLTALFTLFFIAFNILEAIQPSLISRIAPPQAKGKALGLYNTLQAMGLFAGGLLGGWLTRHLGSGAVYLLCAFLTLIWLVLARHLGVPATAGVATDLPR